MRSTALLNKASRKRTPRENVKYFWRKNRTGWLFVLPLVIGLGVFTVYPMIQSFIWSFYNYTGNRLYYPVGLGNYIAIFTRDSEFWRVLGNTVFYTFVSVPIALVTSYLLAVLVNQKMKSVGAFRVLYYLPVIIPGVVSGLLWSDIFAYNGLFNKMLGWVGLHSDFFNSERWYVAIGSIFLMNLWGVGGGMILWLAAFKAIPSQLYEAARIDGGGRVQQFFHVTIPMSMPMIFFNVITMLIGSLQFNGTLVFAYEGKGENDSLYMFAVKIYNEAFKSSKYGYSSALSWVLLFFVGIVTAVCFYVRKKVFDWEEG
ncbi:MAG: sugar ABC transporter permease [Clostridia bacterium]|jgi:ABC-type sugar transport system permease subunit|nr:sugar ABC transporter permease [Clostridia bacterium]